MTDLYKEALLEAKKIKELAEEDAKKSIMEAISPYIKDIISKKINESSEHDFLFHEEEETLDTLDTAGEELSAGPMGDQPNEAPIQIGKSEDVVNATMPGADGMITVSVEDLFKDAPETGVPQPEPEIPEEVPQASVPVTEPVEEPMGEAPGLYMESFDDWKINLLETSEKIDRVFFSKKSSSIVRESLKNKLFSLMESLDSLKEKGKVNSETAKINENKLEFLFLKLKDGNLDNSYLKEDQKEENYMASLKEYAAKLFAESFAEEGTKDGTNCETTASAKHAADVSGVGPGVDLGLNEEMLPVGDTDVADALPGTDPKPGTPEQWAEGEASLSETNQDKVIEEALDALGEEVEAEGHAGFGDSSEKPSVEPMLEMDEAELKEAIAEWKAKKAMMQEKVEEGDQGSVDPEGGHEPAKKHLDDKPKADTGLEEVDELTMKEEADLMGLDADPAATPDAGLPGDDLGMGDDVDADMVINIDLPDEVEDALADVDMSALDDISVSLADVDVNSGNETGADPMSAPPVSAEPALDAPATGTEPAPELDASDGEGEEEDDMMETKMSALMESVKKLENEKKLLESKVKNNASIAKKLKEQSDDYKTQLVEANLFIAKNVYFTKFLQKGTLSQTNLKKIVEHLDRAKTVSQAKEIYNLINKKLAESAAASKKLTGSSSAATSSGSAVSLNESVSHNDGEFIEVERFKKLAGIKSKK